MHSNLAQVAKKYETKRGNGQTDFLFFNFVILIHALFINIFALERFQRFQPNFVSRRGCLLTNAKINSINSIWALNPLKKPKFLRLCFEIFFLLIFEKQTNLLTVMVNRRQSKLTNEDWNRKCLKQIVTKTQEFEWFGQLSLRPL